MKKTTKKNTSISSELNKQLKNRFTLSIQRQDQQLFLECIGNSSVFHMEALTEVFLDFDFNYKNQFLSLLRMLPKEQAIDIIYYWLHHLDWNQIEQTLKPTLNLETRELFFLAVMEELLQSIGTFPEQINFLSSIILHQFVNSSNEKAKNIFVDNIIHFIIRSSPAYEAAFLCNQFVDASPLSLPETQEQAHYPSLKTFFTRDGSGFKKAILQTLKTANACSEQELQKISQRFWRAYLFAMWIELVQTPVYLPSTPLQLFDYWLESLIKNAAEYPKLYTAIEKTLKQNDYFSNDNLRYWFQYRFGDKRQIVRKIMVVESIRQGKCQPEFKAEEFETIAPADHQLLTAALSNALEARQDSIYAQLDFLTQWINWSQDIKRVEHYNFNEIFLLILRVLMNRTPLDVLINSQNDSIITFEDHIYNTFIKSLIFDSQSSQNTLLLFLILKKFINEQDITDLSTIKIYYNLSHTFKAIESNGSSSPENFSALYEEMAKHRFFYREINTHLSRIFFYRTFDLCSKSYDFHSQYTAFGEKIIHAPIIEKTAVLPATKEITDAKCESVISEPAPVAAPATTAKQKKRNKHKKNEQQVTLEPIAPIADPIEPTLTEATPEPVTSEPISIDTSLPSESNEKESEPIAEAADAKCESVTSEPAPVAMTTKKKKRNRPKKNEQPVTQEPTTPITDPIESALKETMPGPVISELISIDTNHLSPSELKEEVCSSTIEMQHQLSQEISSILTQFIYWNISHPSFYENRLGPHHQKLNKALHHYLNLSHALQQQLKDKSGMNEHSLNQIVPVSNANFAEQLQEYKKRVQQLSEIAPEFSEYTKRLNQLTYNEIIQPLLYSQYKLPRSMPVIDELTALLAGKAQFLVYGLQLFLPNPQDIDTRYIWLNPEMSIEQIKEVFEIIMSQADFQLELVTELINGVSYKIRAKGDGYNRFNHKEIGITLFAANPALRPELLHHITHASAALEPETGIIHCDDEAGHYIINGVFGIRDYKTDHYQGAYKIKVHVLNSLMRAWDANRKGLIMLSSGSTQLLSTLKKHQGNLQSLREENPLLEKALIGIIIRHLNQYQLTKTYENRSHLLYCFLIYLGFKLPNRSIANRLETELKRETQDMMSLAQNLGFIPQVFRNGFFAVNNRPAIEPAYPIEPYFLRNYSHYNN